MAPQVRARIGQLAGVLEDGDAPPMGSFRRGRDFSAWLGLVPRQHTTGGKPRLGRISKVGQKDLRRLLVTGAMSVVQHASRRGEIADPWLAGMLARKPKQLVAVALANRTARPDPSWHGRDRADEAHSRAFRPAGDLHLRLRQRRDRREGARLGAADYIVKPFSPTELAALVRAALRRHAGPQFFALGELRISYERRRVTLADRELELTAKEYDLLRVLSRNAGRVMTYQTLLRQVWGKRGGGNPGPVRTYVRKLRHKLGDDAADPAYILTERAVGYRMAEPETGEGG